MEKNNLSKKELEQLCLKDKIVLKRFDPVSETSFYMPNFEKIGIMIREFDFLVEGASRGIAINNISQIEQNLAKNEKNKEIQNTILATNYSRVSIYVESKTDLISDRKSENWNYLFTKYFSLYDIYRYFNKDISASSFFKKFRIYDELVELNANLKLLDYLESQVQLFLPVSGEKEVPYAINSLELTILLLRNGGFLDAIKSNVKDSYYINGAKFITSILKLQPTMWKQVATLLKEMDTGDEGNTMNDVDYTKELKDVLYHYKIDFRKKISLNQHD